jgi:hypothetical protein
VVVTAAAGGEAVPADDGEADEYEDITDLGVEYAEPPFDGEAVAVAAAAAPCCHCCCHIQTVANW